MLLTTGYSQHIWRILQMGLLPGGMQFEQSILGFCLGHCALLCLSDSAAGKRASSIPIYPFFWPCSMAHQTQ